MTLLRTALALAVVALLAPAGVRAAAPPVGLSVAPGFSIERIATVEAGREITVAPNGDLFVGTSTNAVYIVADAQGNAAQFSHGQMIGSNTQHGDIHIAIAANQARVKLATICQRHLDTFGACHHMGVSEDLPIGGKDEA